MAQQSVDHFSYRSCPAATASWPNGWRPELSAAEQERLLDELDGSFPGRLT
jgi:hypothetical protein